MRAGPLPGSCASVRILFMSDDTLHRQNTVACIWDFDKTLIPGYMQTPIFRRFAVDEQRFWNEVNALAERYRSRGHVISPDIAYLNHLLTYVRHGKLAGLSNALLRELGKELRFYPGLPGFFRQLKELVAGRADFVHHHIQLEHYIVSTGLAEMIRGSAVAPHVDGIYGCEFIENPLPPGFLDQPEFPIEDEREIGQIGLIVDNTIKTRAIFEIKKGSNKNPAIDVNAKIRPEDRRVQMENMIYMADGPSDVPVFSLLRKFGGRAFAVYDPENPAEFAQNDDLLRQGRINAYGPADYTARSATSMWIQMHLTQICERIVRQREIALESRLSKPPRHIHREESAPDDSPLQEELFE